MYRHFAVATLAITFCIAMFVDDGRREAISDELEQRQAENQALAAEKEKLGSRDVASKGVKFRDGRSVKGSFGPDPGPPPVTAIAYSKGPNLPPRRVAQGMVEPPSVEEREIGIAYDTPDVLPPGMSEEEMRRFVLIRKGEKAKKRATAEEREKMLDASRRRSGAEDDGED
jgi:hypothetical protein